MERIRQITDTQRCACLWAITAVLATILLFLCSGKVFAGETSDNVFNQYAQEQQTSPRDVIVKIGREKARYEGYGIYVLPDTDVTLLAKTVGLDSYKDQGPVSYKWSSDTCAEINGQTAPSITYRTPKTQTEIPISVDVYVGNQKIKSASATLNVQPCDLDFTIYERTTTSLTPQSTTAPLIPDKRYMFTLKNGNFGWDCGNDETAPFYAWEFTMNGETFTIDDRISEDQNTPIKQPSFMTYEKSVAGGAVPNSTIILKKSGTLKIKAMIYQNNKVFREVEKTFNVPGNSSETTQKTQQTTQTPKQDTSSKQDISLKQGTQITDKKSKVVYKVTGNKTVEYKKSTKKAKNITIPSTVTLNGINYQVTSIAAKAFANNKNLKKVVIPATVKNIGKQAFSSCKNLKNITIKTTRLTNKSVGAKAFKGIHAKATIKVPKKQKKAYQKLLKARGIGKNVKIK